MPIWIDQEKQAEYGKFSSGPLNVVQNLRLASGRRKEKATRFGVA